MAYMSFDEAQVLPFTGEHQPSLSDALLRAVADTKKKQARQRSQLGSARVTYSTAPNITKLKNKSSFKIASATRVRGSVVCNNCIRPRCIYSQNALTTMKPPLPQESMGSASIDEVQKYRVMAKDRLLNAMESTIYMCEMAPLDSDDPCHDIFHCDPSLDCNTHIESEF